MTERYIALKLRYDGSRYHGWQRQRELPTVQETLETALERICGHPVKTVGCGRTDAGVHALRYCVNFKTMSSIPTDRFPLAANTVLPKDIAVLEACEVSESFNAIGSCERKEYIYKIMNSRIRDPFLQERVCFYPAPLDIDAMERAGAAFVGVHDFAAVRSVGTVTRTTVREVYWCSCEKSDNGEDIEIKICANGFLYNMARAIVGTMVYASHGKLRPEDIPLLLEKGDRRLTGPTMPPQGLYMSRLWYKEGELGFSLAQH